MTKESNTVTTVTTYHLLPSLPPTLTLTLGYVYYDKEPRTSTLSPLSTWLITFLNHRPSLIISQCSFRIQATGFLSLVYASRNTPDPGQAT